MIFHPEPGMKHPKAGDEEAISCQHSFGGTMGKTCASIRASRYCCVHGRRARSFCACCGARPGARESRPGGCQAGRGGSSRSSPRDRNFQDARTTRMGGSLPLRAVPSLGTADTPSQPRRPSKPRAHCRTTQGWQGTDRRAGPPPGSKHPAHGASRAATSRDPSARRPPARLDRR